MRLAHRLLFITLGTLFRLTLFLGVTLFAVVILFSNPERIEQTLIDHGTYKQFVPAVTQSISAAQQGNGPVPLTDKDVQKIINDSFTPELLQKNTEVVIDNFYDWLNNKIVVPNYRIDFTPQRDAVANNLAAYAFTRLAALPACTTVPNNINPFSDTCLPRNFPLEAQRPLFTEQLHNLLPKTVYTPDDLPKLANGKSFTDNFPQIPTAYRAVMWSPWILGGTLALLAWMMIQFASTRRRGVRLVGSATLSAGITLIITPILYELVYPTIQRMLNIQTTSTGLNNLSASVMQDLSRSFYNVLISASLFIIGIGVLLIVAERATRDAGYENLSERSGIITSNSSEPAPKTSAKPSSRVPVQSSEAGSQDGLTKKMKQRYRALKRRSDKEGQS